MEAFTIYQKSIAPNIEVLRRGSHYFVSLGSRSEVKVDDRDVETTVLSEDDKSYIHHCGLVARSGKRLITAPLVFIPRDSTPEEQRVIIKRFDQSVLVLWKTGFPGTSIVEASFAEVISQDAGNLLIVIEPGGFITLKIRGENVTLYWSGHEFIWR